jgi:hypothetical protein
MGEDRGAFKTNSVNSTQIQAFVMIGVAVAAMSHCPEKSSAGCGWPSLRRFFSSATNALR